MRLFGLAPLVALLFSFAAPAQEIDLVGDTGWYQWSKRRIGVYADEIANYRDRGFSGPLRLEIIATTNQPTGGDFADGYSIGSLDLYELSGGQSYLDLDYLIRFYAPPQAGLYYTSIVLEELTDIGWEISDWEDLDHILNYGGVGFGVMAADDAHANIFFEGNVSWDSAFKRVLISADHIVNEGIGRSGPLRMRLLALDNEYTGTAQVGFLLATKSLGRLKSGFEFVDYSRFARFLVPPENSYFITLLLEERIGRYWYVRDWINFPGTSLF